MGHKHPTPKTRISFRKELYLPQPQEGDMILDPLLVVELLVLLLKDWKEIHLA